jgi:phosphomannomutase
MATDKIVFGTDGWRAVIADDYTFANVRVCAQAFADELKRDQPGRGCVIAYDNRFQSENFAVATGEVMAANGIKAIVTDRATPTPVLAFTILDRKTAGGVIITASHNPATYNGFKVRAAYGGAADPEMLTRIEANITRIQAGGAAATLAQAAAREKGLFELYDAGPAYEEHSRGLVDTGAIRSTGSATRPSPASTRSRSRRTSARCSRLCAGTAATSGSRPTATPTGSASATSAATSSTSCAPCR